MIFDTDILVWYLRKEPRAAAFVGNYPVSQRNISVISYLEVLYGCRSGEELREFRVVAHEGFGEVVLLDKEMSELAGRLMERFVLSRRPQGEDMLIAATALCRGEPLSTANRKHFDFVPGLEILVYRP